MKLILLIFKNLRRNLVRSGLTALAVVFLVAVFSMIVSVLLWLFRGLEPYWNFIGQDLRKESLLYGPLSKASSFITPALEDIGEEFLERTGK